MSVSVEIVPAHGPEQVAIARQLLREYAAAIGVDLEYQGFSNELAALPSPYAPPQGALLIAQAGADVAGCVALRRLDDNAGEMKRLYVRPAFRGLGIAERLIASIVGAARDAGYCELRLDTLADMLSAQSLYRKLGFVEISPYNDAHLPGTRFYMLRLTRVPEPPAAPRNEEA